MDKKKVLSEVTNAEVNLLNLLRSGDLMKGVAVHLKSPEYRNIWNGEVKTYEMLEQLISKGIANGLVSIDYQVNDREFMIINEENIIETISAVETSTMNDGTSVTSGATIISILWKLIDGAWRLAYLHASELPKTDP